MKHISNNTDESKLMVMVEEVIAEHNRTVHSQNMRAYRNGVVPYIEGQSETEMLAASFSAEEVMITKHELQSLMQDMERLPSLQRRRIYAYFFLELNMTQIAAIENVSIASVSRSIHRGIANLRWMMK